MQRRHGTRGNSTLESITHDQIIPGAKLFKEGKQSRKIVAPIGVSHYHVFSLRCVNSACQDRAVSRCLHGHNSGTHLGGEFYRTVGAAVIGHDNFAGDAVLREKELRFCDALLQCARLVEARHHDRQFRPHNIQGRASVPPGSPPPATAF